MRQNNPQLKALLDEYISTHAAGTSFGNTLIRRYLQNTKWVTNSTSQKDMERFLVTVDPSRSMPREYDFDYLMLAAQGYQESMLQQNRRVQAVRSASCRFSRSMPRHRPSAFPTYATPTATFMPEQRCCATSPTPTSTIRNSTR